MLPTPNINITEWNIMALGLAGKDRSAQRKKKKPSVTLSIVNTILSWD
jgi:hypothetical protein